MDKFNILLSCMYQKDYGIVEKSNINCGAVIINQCENESKTFIGNDILWINSPERGLSKSRNLAIEAAKADICLLADEDEYFVDNCEEIIIKAFSEIKEADIITFDLNNYPSKLKNKIYKLWKYETLRVVSCQIAFRREKIIKYGLKFDVRLGSGSGNGAGEENKFLLDCYNKGLKIYHYPACIAALKESQSTWFKGYDEKFFYQRGMVTRYYLGFFVSSFYALYYVWVKRNYYRGCINTKKALLATFKGILENKLQD